MEKLKEAVFNILKNKGQEIKESEYNQVSSEITKLVTPYREYYFILERRWETGRVKKTRITAKSRRKLSILRNKYYPDWGIIKHDVLKIDPIYYYR